MLVDKVKDWGSPWLFCALHVSQEGEPEETAETDVDGPQPSRHEFEVDGLKDWPNQDPGLGRGNRVLIVCRKSFGRYQQQFHATYCIYFQPFTTRYHWMVITTS